MEEINMSGASLEGANLFDSNLSKANLSNLDFSGANLFCVNLYKANLNTANLSDTFLGWANLTKSSLKDADMSQANLKKAILSGSNLDNVKFTNVNLDRTTYEPISVPDKNFLRGIQNLETVSFDAEKQSGLVLLRNSLKEVGLRELERKATYAIEKGKTDHYLSMRDKAVDSMTLGLEQFSIRLFFEYTAGYGLYPKQCLIILFAFIPLFAIVYFFSIYNKRHLSPYFIAFFFLKTESISSSSSLESIKSGIYKSWSEHRIRKDLGSTEPELIFEDFITSLGYAFYFSFLSAFHIGWREINVGSWIARIQSNEYTLKSTGWVRTISGIQSLISIYLLAFWVLTQFGRPFD
jgi:hypothetical protein